MTKINLLPDHLAQAQGRCRCWWQYAAAASVLLGLAAAWWTLARGQLQRNAAAQQAVEQNLALERQRGQGLVAQAEACRRLREVLAMQRQTQAPLPVAALVAELSRLVPDSVALTQLSVNLPGAASGTGGSGKLTRSSPAAAPGVAAEDRVGVALQGMAMNDTEVGRLVSILSRRPLFTNVTLNSSRHALVGEEARSVFQIGFEVPVGGGGLIRRTKSSDSPGDNHPPRPSDNSQTSDNTQGGSHARASNRS